LAGESGILPEQQSAALGSTSSTAVTAPTQPSVDPNSPESVVRETVQAASNYINNTKGYEPLLVTLENETVVTLRPQRLRSGDSIELLIGNNLMPFAYIENNSIRYTEGETSPYRLTKPDMERIQRAFEVATPSTSQ
jgi:hypothetical protein